MLFLVLAAVHCSPVISNIVSLDYGQFAGTRHENYTSFTGIPYAQPPTGDLRWRAPRPPKHIAGVQESLPAVSCMQRPPALGMPALAVSEDCLVLNVFVPRHSSHAPVLVYIYGGSFITGSAYSPLNNAANIMDADVAEKPVIVVLNYRLGVFGFLSAPQMPPHSANLGLLDQKLALEWVRKYACAFGGDPENITVFGQSAGAISIGAHLVAQGGSQKLFDRAVLFSGSPLLVYSKPEIAQASYLAVLARTKCTDYACLQTKNSTELLAAAGDSSFGIVVDHEYIDAQPMAAYASGNFSKVPVIVSTNRDEGAFFTTSVTDVASAKLFVQASFPFVSTNDLPELYALYPRSNYTFDAQQVGDMFGDAIFQCSAALMAQAYQSSNSLQFKTQFNHLPLVPLSPLFKYFGVYHGAEIPYLWQIQQFIQPEERELSKAILAGLLNFAAGRMDLVPKLMYPEQFSIDIHSQVTVDTSRIEKCQFWMRVVKSIS